MTGVSRRVRASRSVSSRSSSSARSHPVVAILTMTQVFPGRLSAPSCRVRMRTSRLTEQPSEKIKKRLHYLNNECFTLRQESVPISGRRYGNPPGKEAGKNARERAPDRAPSTHCHTCRTVTAVSLFSHPRRDSRTVSFCPVRLAIIPPGPAIPAPQRLPASSRSSRGELTGGGVPAPAFRPVPCPRLPPMPGYRGMRVLFRHEASRGRTHSLPPRICPTCLRKIPGSPGILSCSCRLTFFRRPDENSARQTGGLSAPARDARL
mgnify:CR=1 FL=1